VNSTSIDRRRTRSFARGPVIGLAAVLLLVGSATAASAEGVSGNQWPATVVAGATTPVSTGIWSAQANGVVTVHDLQGGFHGDARRTPLAQPIAGIAATPTGNGYWLVAADGGVFSYGDAHFYGSMAAQHLNQPVVGIASTKDGRGYWLAAADGGIFTFGDAHFYGSMAASHLDQPIAGVTATRSGKGYRLVAGDGGIFTFGDATYRGSLGGQGLNDVVGFAPTPSGNGYWILRRFGGMYSCGVNITIGGCDLGPSTSFPPNIPGPSVYNFGDAQNAQPVFARVGFGGHFLYNDPDFMVDPAVAIMANPATQGYPIQGYVIDRAQNRTGGYSLAPNPR
jgi:hypothetical protein